MYGQYRNMKVIVVNVPSVEAGDWTEGQGERIIPMFPTSMAQKATKCRFCVGPLTQPCKKKHQL